MYRQPVNITVLGNVLVVLIPSVIHDALQRQQEQKCVTIQCKSTVAKQSENIIVFVPTFCQHADEDKIVGVT